MFNRGKRAMTHIPLVCVHGWGLTPHTWGPFLRALAACLPRTLLQRLEIWLPDMEFCRCPPRAAPPLPDLPARTRIVPARDAGKLPRRAIWIGHSLGLAWSLRHAREPLALAAIAGFPAFPAPAESLEAMERGIARRPSAQLAAFLRRAGAPATWLRALRDCEQDRQALLTGLRWLREWDERGRLPGAGTAEETPLVILAARDDAIIPAAVMRRLWRPRAIHWCEDAGHLLPLTQPEACARHVAPLLFSGGGAGETANEPA